MTASVSREDHRQQRRFSFSSNRDSARHRIRYTEAGGAGVDNAECTFCQSNPDLEGPAQEHGTHPASGTGLQGT